MNAELLFFDNFTNWPQIFPDQTSYDSFVRANKGSACSLSRPNFSSNENSDSDSHFSMFLVPVNTQNHGL